MYEKIDVSIVVPGIRTSLWLGLYNSIQKACTSRYSFEIIFVGPYPPSKDELFRENSNNVIFIHDFSSPCRSAQLGSIHAKGQYITWAADDGYYIENSLANIIDMLRSFNYDTHRVEVIARYSEGKNHSGKMMPDEYWSSWHHGSLRLEGVPTNSLIAPVGLLHRAYWEELGGFDTRFEQLNMCCIDLSLRIQNHGGNLILSPGLVMSYDWKPGEPEHKIMMDAYNENDYPLFVSLWSKSNAERIKIRYNNWEDSDAVWKRRFGNKE